MWLGVEPYFNGLEIFFVPALLSVFFFAQNSLFIVSEHAMEIGIGRIRELSRIQNRTAEVWLEIFSNHSDLSRVLFGSIWLFDSAIYGRFRPENHCYKRVKFFCTWGSDSFIDLDSFYLYKYFIKLCTNLSPIYDINLNFNLFRCSEFVR